MRNNNLPVPLKYTIIYCFLLITVCFHGCKSKLEEKSKENDLAITEIPNNQDSWVKIFDGKTLNNWEGDPKYWHVENGSLIGEITPKTLLDRNSFITWQGTMPDNFELKLEYRVSEEGNSGINYRSEPVEGVPFALRGYQADLDGKQRYTGMNYEERKRTTIASRGEKVELTAVDVNPDSLQKHVSNNRWMFANVVEKLGNKDDLAKHIKNEDWNEYHLIINQNKLQHYVNGILMSEVIDNDPVNQSFSGKLGVQVHVGPPMKIEYKNIRIKSL